VTHFRGKIGLAEQDGREGCTGIEIMISEEPDRFEPVPGKDMSFINENDGGSAASAARTALVWAMRAANLNFGVSPSPAVIS
jgi:hypothetical protein